MPPEEDVITQAPEPVAAPPALEPAPAPVVETPPPRMVPAERFDAVVADKYKAIRETDAANARTLLAEQELTALRSRQSAAPAPEPSPVAASMPTMAELDAMANQRAMQIDFNKRCNESVSLGRKTYADFNEKIAQLSAIAPSTDSQGRPVLPQTLVEAALETGKAHDVLYALANDSIEADRIMSLPPMKQAIEITRLADKLASADTDPDADEDNVVAQAEAARVSAAPRPIRPKIGSGVGQSNKNPSLDDPKLSTEDWMKIREKQVKENRVANGRFRY